jgi:alkylation response protein AidB-like acyl-CoA dehydrogenase
MNAYLSHRNLNFILFEVLEAHKLNRFAYYADYDRSSLEMSLETARQIADTHLFPFYEEMDRKKAYFDAESATVKTHPQLKTLIQAIAEAGFISANAPYENGGLQMPLTFSNAALLTFYAANVNACYPFLTTGAANLILSFGSETLKQTYLPEMYAGAWQGTMALTEPQAGSSLSDLVSTAEPTETEGVFKITGQKIYISGGDHDAVSNVVHLYLARIKGAPQGTKGISLFVVPKFRPSENGNFEPNDVITAGIYGKMGQKGYVAAHLMFGENNNCLGYLIGEANKGLTYMFQMMNEARIGTGLVAAGAASAAYYSSVKYAFERPQGRKPSTKNPLDPPVLIVEHADVRRMLFFQKAVVEGSIALLLKCSHYADLSAAETGESAENAHLILEVLTPIAKSYPSEMGTQSVSMGMQVLGGAGYCEDFPIEQIYRDIRVNAIYEGTTTIHGLDLLGRKVMLKNGKGIQLLSNELAVVIKKARSMKSLSIYADKLSLSGHELQTTAMKIYDNAPQTGADSMMADATLFLEFAGIIALAWVWLEQAVVAQAALERNLESEDERNFYESKIATMRYFFEYELPKTLALKTQLLNFDKLTVSVNSNLFV